jgi:hypothetical protein
MVCADVMICSFAHPVCDLSNPGTIGAIAAIAFSVVAIAISQWSMNMQGRKDRAPDTDDEDES